MPDSRMEGWQRGHVEAEEQPEEEAERTAERGLKMSSHYTVTLYHREAVAASFNLLHFLQGRAQWAPGCENFRQVGV